VSLSDVIAQYGTGSYTVTRSTPGVPVDGIQPQPSTATFSISASIQPVDGATLEDLPEGQRIEQSRVIWTTTALVARQESPPVEPDAIVIDGDEYRVTKVSYFGILDSFYRCYAEMVNVAP
jgi:hypothetical protein